MDRRNSIKVNFASNHPSIVIKCMDVLKYHKAHASIGPNFVSLPLIAFISCIFLFAGSAITEIKVHLHGFVNILDIFFQNRKRELPPKSLISWCF